MTKEARLQIYLGNLARFLLEVYKENQIKRNEYGKEAKNKKHPH